MNPIDLVNTSEVREEQILQKEKKARLQIDTVQLSQENTTKDRVIKLNNSLQQKTANNIQMLEIRKSGLQGIIEQAVPTEQLYPMKVDLLNKCNELITKFSNFLCSQVDSSRELAKRADERNKKIEAAKVLKDNLCKATHLAKEESRNIIKQNADELCILQPIITDTKIVAETTRKSLEKFTQELGEVLNKTKDIDDESAILENQNLKEMLHNTELPNFDKEVDNITVLEKNLAVKKSEIDNLAKALNEFDSTENGLEIDISAINRDLVTLKHDQVLQAKTKELANNHSDLEQQLEFYQSQIAGNNSKAEQCREKQESLQKQEAELQLFCAEIDIFTKEQDAEYEVINSNLIQLKEGIEKEQLDIKNEEILFQKEILTMEIETSAINEKRMRLLHHLDNAKKIKEDLMEKHSRLKRPKSSLKSPMKNANSPSNRKVTFNEYVAERQISDESSQISAQNSK